MRPDLEELWKNAAAEMDRNFQNAGPITIEALTQTIEAIRAGEVSFETLSFGQRDHKHNGPRVKITLTNGFHISWVHRPRARFNNG